MTRKIIVGVVPERAAETHDALVTAAALADATGSELLVVDVVEPTTTPARRAESEEALERAVERTLSNGTPRPKLELRVIAAHSPARVLHELADRLAPEAVVVGTSRRGANGRTVPGSIGEMLLHGGPSPVVVAPHGAALRHAGMGTIAVGYQDTPEGREALRRAVDIAGRAGARLRLISVLEAGPAGQIPFAREAEENELEHRTREQMYIALHEAAVSLPVPAEGLLVDGDPARALAVASQGFSLLVLGSRGYGPLRAVLLGPVSRALVRTSACPVMVVPRIPAPQEDVALAGGLDVSLGA